MKVKIKGNIYQIEEKESKLSEEIRRLAPFRLTLTRSAGHEFYGSLPEKVSTDGAPKTSHVEAGGIYYFKDWNAFSLNYKETEIAPWQVYVVGKAEDSLVQMLASFEGTLEAEILA